MYDKITTIIRSRSAIKKSKIEFHPECLKPFTKSAFTLNSTFIFTIALRLSLSVSLPVSLSLFLSLSLSISLCLCLSLSLSVSLSLQGGSVPILTFLRICFYKLLSILLFLVKGYS